MTNEIRSSELIRNKLTTELVIVGLLEMGKCTQSELSHHTGLDKAYISNLMPKIARMELVKITHPDDKKTDRRIVYYELTKLGEAQAYLSKMRLALAPGVRDPIAEACIKAAKSVLNLLSEDGEKK